jgi:tight adherence protein B
MFLILNGYASKRKIAIRVKEFLGSEQEETPETKPEIKMSFFQKIYRSTADLFKSVQFSRKTERLLLEAGNPLKPEEYFALRIFVSAGIGIFTVLLEMQWYFWLLFIVVGFELPMYFVKRRRKKRLNQLTYQLIEALGMMGNSMRAGFSFMQAMQLVGKEIPDPLGPEFDRCVRQARLGIPLEDVFAELIDRLPNKELDVVLSAILTQRSSGGNMAELLETMEETIRGRVRVLEELRTLTAQGRMSSWIITLLPVGLALYLALVNRDYFSPMLNHPLGLTILFIGAFLILIGWVLIQKIINIEV